MVRHHSRLEIAEESTGQCFSVQEINFVIILMRKHYNAANAGTPVTA